MFNTILTFVIVFGILVIIHEFGHYYFAKRAGILVREFSIGFGPKVFSHHKDETTYTVRILPLGGYVRMAGYDEQADIRPGMPISVLLNDENEVTKINTNSKKALTNSIPLEVTETDLEKELFIKGRLGGNADNIVQYSINRKATVIEQDGTEVQIAPIDRQFQSAPIFQRMLTNFAGPMNNIILAIVAFILVAFMQGGVLVNDPVVGEVIEDAPADNAGLVSGDIVRSIDGEEISNWNEMVRIIQSHPEDPLIFSVDKENRASVEVEIVPDSQTIESGEAIGIIGIQAQIDRSFQAKIAYGFTQTYFIITSILGTLGSIFTNGFSVNMFGGPVAIYATTETVVETGTIGIINWLGLLSINLGIINLLPIPALDGGKLLLNLVEAIRGKPISEEKEGIITLIGVGLLVFLMIAVTWNDIQRFFFN